MPTALFTKARTAGLVALTLVIAAAGAYPAQAGRLIIEKPIGEMGSGMSRDRHDCDSRREIKEYFEEEYYLRHVDVSKTHDYYIYRVSGIGDAKKEAALTSQLSKKSDHVRYVFLYDACDHHVVKQLEPRRTVSEM